jgi:DNA-binding MarR family transcriptional regulator
MEHKKEKCYCISLRRASRVVTDYYDWIFCPSGITLNQYSILVHVYNNSPCSVIQLAKSMKLDRSTLVRNMKPLFEIKLIDDTAGKENRDRRLILTKSGLKRLETAKPLWERAQMDIKGIIGERHLTGFFNTISRLENIRKGR